MTDDVLGISKYVGWTANKRQVYGIRGIGPTYNAFWKTFSRSYKPTWESDDFPWSYVAMDEENEQRFLTEFAESIKEDVNDDPPYDSVLDKKETPIDSEAKKLNDEILSILQKEIQKEINKQVIDEIFDKVN
jgi:hypothetical protein